MLLLLLACATTAPPPLTVEAVAEGWFGTDAGSPAESRGAAPGEAVRLSGRVVDVAGEAIQGATVGLYWSPPEPLATAAAAPDGTWHLPIDPTWSDRWLTMVATAPGYSPWSAQGALADLPARVRMTRPVETVEAALSTSTGPARLRVVLELLASPRSFVDLDGDIGIDELGALLGLSSRAEAGLFRVTGAILPELRTLTDSPLFARPGSPAELAREALVAWGDPEDSARVASLPARWQARPLDLSAPTPEALCERYVAWRVEREQGQAEGTCGAPWVDQTGTRACFELELGYPGGASTHRVVARRVGDTWTVQDHRETRHQAFSL